MTTPSRFLVGLDQFIKLEWADYALASAATGAAPEFASSELRAYLVSRITSPTTARKTANVLSRLWFPSFPDLETTRRDALELYSQAEVHDRVLLHWGMAIVSFPIFRETCVQIGRLVRLQGQFKRSEVQDRVLEKAGNHGTLPRALYRIIQTLVDWGAVTQVKPHVYGITQQDKSVPSIQQWLLETAVWATPGRRVLLDDLARLPELFPFDVNGDVRRIVSDSQTLTTERDGNNLVYVVRR